MIRLTDLSGNGSFTMGGKKFEYGKVYSNPFASAFNSINEAEGEDHEVSMAQNQLDAIIKYATELKKKMGEGEKEIPAWIQDHISKSENYISQASNNYHEYGDSNEGVVNETKFYAFFNNKKHEIEAKDLWDAKQKAITMLKVPKSKVGYLAIVNAKEHDGGSYRFESVNELKKLPSGNFSIKVGYPTFADYEKKAKVGDIILRYDKRGGMIKTFVDGSELNKKAEKYLDKVNNITRGVVYLSKKGMTGVAQVPDYEKKDIGVLVLESLINEASEAQLINNMKQTIKDLETKLRTTKDSKEREMIKKNIAVNTGLLNWWKTRKEVVSEAGPCWKGYKQVGMKMKNGKEVPNCVPEGVVKEISSKTPKIFVKTAAVEKKIRELMADRKKAVVPYNKETDPAKKEKLKQVLIKLTNQIKGYEKNLVQLRDMEEEYLQQMHADAELDTSGL